jgi:hypothetical protein
MGFAYTEIICKFVTYKSFQQVIDVNPILFVFAKNSRKIEEIIKLFDGLDGSNRKRYIVI